MNPITTGSIRLCSAPAILIVQQDTDSPITYASIGLDKGAAIDVLRQVIIHMVAELHGCATVPAAAAVVGNGRTAGDIPPPLRVPKAKPSGSAGASSMRGKSGPKPGSGIRRRKMDANDDLLAGAEYAQDW